MPDIIEQLEKGKELLENGGIDIDSLKTKFVSTDEKNDKKAEQKRRKSEEDISDDNKFNENNDRTSDNIDNSDDYNNDISSVSADKDDNKNSEEKVEKYPGFDFTQTYIKGQTIYYVKVNNIIGEKELMELRIRTVYPKMLICCTEKAFSQCIGPDTADYIFMNRHQAVECYNKTVVQQKTYETYIMED